MCSIWMRLAGAPLRNVFGGKITTFRELAERGMHRLKHVFRDPMSLGREFGQTNAACLALQDKLTAVNLAIPMWMMADIDHGDATSPDPDDFDPDARARAVPRVSPIIHIKQSLLDNGGHRPLTQHRPRPPTPKTVSRCAPHGCISWAG